MTPTPQGLLPFARQRLVFLALLAGMVFYALAVWIMLQQNDGKGLAREPIPVLDTVVMVVGAALAVTSFVLRNALQQSAEAAPVPARAGLRFRAVLVPLAMLEGGCLFALTAWMLHGTAMPNLAVALVLLALALYHVPFTDPDAGA
jgi:hypothetical protein